MTEILEHMRMAARLLDGDPREPGTQPVLAQWLRDDADRIEMAGGFTDADVQRCVGRAHDLEARIDNEGPDIGLYEEMNEWTALAARIRARLLEPTTGR
jgi:hypothetical protein